jgi:hypothetical protein
MKCGSQADGMSIHKQNGAAQCYPDANISTDAPSGSCSNHRDDPRGLQTTCREFDVRVPRKE